jgi:hypothetical protein
VDEFAAAQARLRRPHGYKAWWERLDLTPEQHEQLMAAGANPDISHRAIHIVLSGWGCQVTLGQIGHWRRNQLGMLLR